jgi:hypothetical protein
MSPNTSTKQSIRCGGPRTASCVPKETIYFTPHTTEIANEVAIRYVCGELKKNKREYRGIVSILDLTMNAVFVNE